MRIDVTVVGSVPLGVDTPAEPRNRACHAEVSSIIWSMIYIRPCFARRSGLREGGKPVTTFRDPAARYPTACSMRSKDIAQLYLEHDLIRKPVTTFRDHAPLTPAASTA